MHLAIWRLLYSRHFLRMRHFFANANSTFCECKFLNLRMLIFFANANLTSFAKENDIVVFGNFVRIGAPYLTNKTK